MRPLRCLFLAVLLACAEETVTHAQILNGSFENPAVSDVSILGLGLTPGARSFSSGSTGITDWTVSGGSVSIVNAGPSLTSLLGLFTAQAGNQYVTLNGLSINILGVVSAYGSAGTLTQTFSTMAGRTYEVSFAYRGLALGLLSNNTGVDVSVSNSSASTLPTGGLVSVNLALGWQTETFQFTATGNTSALSFVQDPSGTNLGLVSLDNVTLTALPEPAQYGEAATLFLGLLIAGRIFRDRMSARQQMEEAAFGERGQEMRTCLAD